MSTAERISVAIAFTATIGFGIWAFVSDQPSTLTYVLSAPAGIVLIGWFRRDPLPDLLAFALAAHAVLHLSGGLIRVGDDVLYNAAIGPYAGSLRTHVLQYDHLVHAYGSFVGALTLWTVLAPDSLRSRTPSGRRNVIVLCGLAGLGIGALNEMIEFLATVAHNGAHVGGYDNTGWDLVSNMLGALAAAVLLEIARPKAPTTT